MAKFCTQCGTPSEDNEAQFCQSCGTPLPHSSVPRMTSKPGEVSPPASTIPLARIAKISISGIVLLVLLGGGAWLLTKAPTAPDASALSALLNTDVKATEQRVCIGDFAYDKNPVFVGNNDTFTKNWLAQLVIAGIYNQPEVQTTGTWFRQTQYKYTHTPDGMKAIKNGKLCFADGIAIDNVEYSEPLKIKDKTYIEAKYTYHYANPAAWINQPEVKELDAEHFGQSSFSDSANLALEDGKWEVASEKAKFNFGSGSDSDSDFALPQASSSSPVGGFFDWVNNLFSSMGGNPLIGKWRIDSKKTRGASVNTGRQLEFSADEMRDGSSVHKIKYKVHGDKVQVTGAGDLRSMVFVIIDHDHIVLYAGLGKLHLRRVN